jgi:hypothetical protein
VNGVEGQSVNSAASLFYASEFKGDKDTIAHSIGIQVKKM